MASIAALPSRRLWWKLFWIQFKVRNCEDTALFWTPNYDRFV